MTLGACLLTLAACGTAPVEVRAFLRPGVPLGELEISAVPFDVAALLDSLGELAPAPRPDFPELEEEVREYRRGVGRSVGDDVTGAWLATRDSVKRLSQALSRMDRNAPSYREAYARFRDLYQRYAAREAAREAGLRRLFAGDRELAERAARAADALRAWERAAYGTFPELAAARARGRPARRVRTDTTGGARLDLPGGRWWLNARFPDPDNPFHELQWNVPVAVTAGLPFAVPLLEANAVKRWRH
ncbi:MAG: hypothetical protein HY560_01825 [Gemmatimonadetes bacterium]|nr:hypothetical protein [Gemmatimonadota bacterium]